MKYEVGNVVRFSHLAGGGIVIQILDDSNYQIEDDNGFVNNYHHTQLLLDHSKPEYFIKPIKTNKDFISKVKLDKPTKPKIPIKIDLHLDGNNLQFTNTQLLDTQLNMFQTAINQALLNNQNEITIIHGIGKGVLKKAIIEKITGNRHILNYVVISEGCLKVILKKNI